jgi:hypothetical protein
MTEPSSPVATSEPIAPPEVARVASHLTLWLEQHVAPEFAKVKADAARALEYAKAHAAQDEAVASLLAKIVSAADPAAAPVLAALLPEAEAVLAKAEQWVADLTGTGM